MARSHPSLFALADAGEPYRLLFPLGLALGLAGVLVWPLAAAGWLFSYPSVPHARIMVQGFLTAFVMGFLGTALPRLLEVPKIRLRLSLPLAAGLAGATLLHLLSLHPAGDSLYLLTLGSFVTALLLRAPQRRDTPPPGFVLVALGLLSALAGTALILLHEAIPGGSFPPPWLYRAGRLLAWQGFLLLPIMGIGAFFLPRFFGLPNRQEFPESLSLPPGWLPRAAFAAACGAAVLAGFFLEAVGALQAGCILRAAAVLVYFWREVPVHQAGFAGGSLARSLRLALAALPLGYLAIGLLPAASLTLLHIVFIGGFGLITLTVATRVILGHSGQTSLFRAPLPAVDALLGLTLAALLLRLAPGWFPSRLLEFLAAAAFLWAAGALLWARGLFPGLRLPGDDPH